MLLRFHFIHDDTPATIGPGLPPRRFRYRSIRRLKFLPETAGAASHSRAAHALLPPMRASAQSIIYLQLSHFHSRVMLARAASQKFTAREAFGPYELVLSSAQYGRRCRLRISASRRKIYAPSLPDAASLVGLSGEYQQLPFDFLMVAPFRHYWVPDDMG